MSRQTEESGLLPFLKWAGGKRKLARHVLDLLPASCGTYYEPFLGGGAVFFALPRGYMERAVLSDMNEELVATTQTIRNEAEAVYVELENYERDHSEVFYYEVRKVSWKARDRVGAAARMLYLNRAGYNGMYRVNKAGRFNIPWGKHEVFSYPSRDHLQRCGERLHSATGSGISGRIVADDFSEIVASAKSGDCVYFDPPYLPASSTANFASYTKDGFTLADHECLAATFARLCKKGVRCVLSMCDTPEALSIYGGVLDGDPYSVTFVSRAGTMSSKGSGRGRVGELLIAGGPL